MTPHTLATFATALLFVGLLASVEVGFRLGARRRARGADAQAGGTGLLDGAVLGLLVVLLAFSLFGAAGRAEARQQLVVGEAIALATAWRHVDLYPGGVQAQVRDLLRQYVELRLETFRALPDEAAARQHSELATGVQERLWAVAIATVGATPGAQQLVLGGLGELFDYPARRAAAHQAHPPPAVPALLGVLALAVGLLAGVRLGERGARRWLHATLCAGLVSATLLVIVGLEYPREERLRVDGGDQPLVEVRRAMK